MYLTIGLFATKPEVNALQVFCFKMRLNIFIHLYSS